MTDSIKHIIFLVVLLAFAGLFYYAMQTGIFSNGPRERAIALKAETANLKKEIIAPLEQLNNVKIDTGIFTDKVFTSLNNMSEELDDPELQRSDPFAPVSFQANLTY